MDLSRLSPSDAAVALRSLERRFRALFAGLGEDESPDDLAQRRGTDGWSALAHVVAASRSIAATGRALRAVLATETPTLAPSDLDPTASSRPERPTGTVHERLAELGIEAGEVAELAERTSAKDWQRTAVVENGASRTITALDVLRAAVDSGVTHLRAAERVLKEVRA